MKHVYRNIAPFQVLQRDSANVAHIIINDKEFTLPVGGPFTVGDCTNVYVGDVWIMAGQSNMRGHGFLHNPFNNEPLTINSAENVCLYDSTEKWRKASEPTHYLIASPRAVHHTLPDPTVATPEICKFRGASLGISFANEYQKLAGNVPVGLVTCAHGGTSLDDWKRPENIDQYTVQNTLYGAMIDKIRAVGNEIAGILWFQGETDAGNLEASEKYGENFKNWLDILRKDTRIDMPVAFVQIGPHRITIPEIMTGWENVQEHQRKLFGYKSITAGVASLDCSLDDRIHISASGLIKVGQRLAKAALQAVAKRAEAATPTCEAAVFEQTELVPSRLIVHSIKLVFSHMEDFEWINNENLEGFGLKNHENNIDIISVKIEGKDVRLYLTKKPVTSSVLYVNYGMRKVNANLKTTNGSALPAFKKIPVFIT